MLRPPASSSGLDATPDHRRTGAAPPDDSHEVVAQGLFPSTMWNEIVDAGSEDPSLALSALNHLARAYWRPLYVFLRQRRHDHDDAADLVQGFFEHMLSRGFLRHAQPQAGRFRTFLLVCFTRWLHDQRSRATAERRGGGQTFLSLEELEALRETLPVEGQSPEDAFDRRWAQEVLDTAQRRLREDWSSRLDLFTALRGLLGGNPEPSESYADIGKRLGMTEGAIKKAAFDLRQGIGRLVRAEVLRTVRDEADVTDELRHLVRLLRH
ncbi:MAG TPA: sigma-70 family RNA polymerase sigma factor [Verrucomicrobiota bacterium]|nr:sigma-70 family RNA polymerase sigma factor [Verrucomicrobiota bacterium]